MANEYTLGIYKYRCKINDGELVHLPDQLKIDTISPCGVLLELVMGKMDILNSSGEVLYVQEINYARLPAEIQITHTYEQFSEILNIDVLDDDCRNICNRFMMYDRTNNFVYEHILNELTQFFVINRLSPCEGFVHLYRTLEFMSYSFPLIYASKSKSYRGTYDSLKKFLSGDSGGELKFFQKFLKEVFEDDIAYQYEFEVYVDSENIEELKGEFQEIFNIDFYTFEENTLLFKFKNVTEMFIEIRNRYFHMLLGQGRNNFFNMEYDKNDLFKSLNPVFVNWLSIIFVKIIQQGIESCG